VNHETLDSDTLVLFKNVVQLVLATLPVNSSFMMLMMVSALKKRLHLLSVLKECLLAPTTTFTKLRENSLPLTQMPLK
jgi:hypothetical protein